jgi:prophage regulatory protein
MATEEFMTIPKDAQGGAPGRPLRLLKIAEVKDRTGIKSDSKVYDEVAKGRLDPPVPLGPNSVAWVETEVDEYIRARIAERDKALAHAAAKPKAEINRRPGRPQRSIWHQPHDNPEPAAT